MENQAKKIAVIYGSTGTGQSVYRQVKEKYSVISFVDGNPERVGNRIDDIPVYDREWLLENDFDLVIMGVMTGYDEIVAWLTENGIEEEKIVLKYVDLSFRARKECVRGIAEIIRVKDVDGAVAELGVYRGDFARIINAAFPERLLYLFDTFEGFPEQDIAYEREHNYLTSDIGRLSNTSESLVLGKMPYKERCVIRKGYFPDTTEGLEEERFAFVNIDVDLYKPIRAGLRFFYPRMSKGGVLLVHDYFSNAYSGTQKAVLEFSEEYGVGYVPIGDGYSIAIVRGAQG